MFKEENFIKLKTEYKDNRTTEQKLESKLQYKTRNKDRNYKN